MTTYKKQNFNILQYTHKFFLSALFATFFCIGLYAAEYNNEANFKQIYTKTLNGDIAATGSPIMCADDGRNSCNWNYKGYLFDINPKTLHDGNITTFAKNSGGAILKLPSDVNGSDILWARLYWQGHIFGLGNHTTFLNAINGLENVKMIDPKGNIHNLNAKSSDIYYYGYDNHDIDGEGKGFRYFYQASTDVTSIVQQSYDPAHNYFIVGNINATMTKDTKYIYDTKTHAYVKWGNWGGWSLIVVYKNPNDSVKNISLYDGFKFLIPPFGGTASLTIDLPPNSFYTPTYGTVKSKTIMFSAGAEKKISADKLEMKNKNKGYETVYNDLNPANDQMNDSITYLDQEINSTRIFNAGIDLDTYNTSNILANGQTTTSIKATMTASAHASDQAFIGFIGISNDIYQPKICYIEQLYDNNQTEINATSHINVGDTLQVKLTIRNDDNQSANDVDIIHSFENNATSYEENSTIVNNIDNSGNLLGDTNETDILGDDLVDFNQSSKSLTIRLGRGANNSQGGTFNPNDTVYAKFKTKVNINQRLSLSYQTSYKFTIAGQTFKFNGPLPKCTNFDNTIHAYLSPSGVFNVINDYTPISDTDPLNNNSYINSLYTQVTDQHFQVKVLHLNSSDKKTLENFRGIAFLQLIDASNLTTNQSSCLSAPILYQLPPNNIPNFDNNSFKDINISIPIATKNTTFRVGFTDWGTRINDSNVTCADMSTTTGNLKGVPACLDSQQKISEVFPDKNISDCLTSGPYGSNAACNPSNYNANGSKGNIQPEVYNNKYGCAQCLVGNYVCARDAFAIRPATYNIELNSTTTKLIGGKIYPLDINATNEINNTAISSYNQIINNSSDKNGTIQIIAPTGCNDINKSIKLFGTNLVFSNGSANQPAYFSYNNIGDINITISDNKWTKVDQQPKSDNSIDCIQDSSSNNHNANNKVGCIAKGNKILTFIPKAFRASLNLSNNSNNLFTYISDDGNMSANLNWTFAAVLDDNTSSTLIDNAIATNYTKNCFSKDINFSVKLINDKNLTWGSAKNRIKFFGENNQSTKYNSGISFADFNSSKLNFFHGEANITTHFNFDRNTSTADEPFKIYKNDFNLTNVNDNDGVNGSDFNRSNNLNATFYYGRVHAPDYSSSSNTISNAKIYYEAYCKDCNKSAFPSLGTESVDDIYWYINKDHNSSNSGQIFGYPSSLIATPTGKISISSVGNVSFGIENKTITYNGSTYPYRERLDMNTSNWLIFNPYDENAKYNSFNVEFYGKGGWAGIGQIGKTVDLNVSSKSSKRIEW